LMKIIEMKNQNGIRKLNKKKVMIASIVALILLIFLILFIVYSACKPFRDVIDKYVLMKNVVEDSTNSINIDENETNYIYGYDKYISVLNKNTLKNYNSSGKLEGEITIDISNPIMATNGKFLLIAEKDKNKIYLVSGNEIIWQKELEGNIDKMSVNKNGYVAVILSGISNPILSRHISLSVSANNLFLSALTFEANSLYSVFFASSSHLLYFS